MKKYKIKIDKSGYFINYVLYERHYFIGVFRYWKYKKMFMTRESAELWLYYNSDSCYEIVN